MRQGSAAAQASKLSSGIPIADHGSVVDILTDETKFHQICSLAMSSLQTQSEGVYIYLWKEPEEGSK